MRALKLEREIGMTPWDQFVRTINFCEAGGRTDKAEAVFKVGKRPWFPGETVSITSRAKN